MNNCINCGKSPLFQLAFKDEDLSEYVNRFCQECIREFDNYHEHMGILDMTGKIYRDKIFCEHCKDNDYTYNMNVCKTCDVAFCTNCSYFHICFMFHFYFTSQILRCQFYKWYFTIGLCNK